MNNLVKIDRTCSPSLSVSHQHTDTPINPGFKRPARFYFRITHSKQHSSNGPSGKSYTVMQCVGSIMEQMNINDSSTAFRQPRPPVCSIHR